MEGSLFEGLSEYEGVSVLVVSSPFLKLIKGTDGVWYELTAEDGFTLGTLSSGFLPIMDEAKVSAAINEAITSLKS